MGLTPDPQYPLGTEFAISVAKTMESQSITAIARATIRTGVFALVVYSLSTVCVLARENDKDGKAESPKELITEWQKPFPLGFLVDYSLMSAYRSRKGFDCSAYPGSGHSVVPNQQLLVTMSLALKDVMDVEAGSFSLGYWADWNEGQKHITPGTRFGEMKEWDLLGTWTYEIPKTPLTFSLGYALLVYPPCDTGNAAFDSYSGSELRLSLALDDSVLFGQPVLSPCISMVRDIDHYNQNWFDVGFSRTFKELGIPHLSLTPKVVLGIDDGYVEAVLGQEPKTHPSLMTYSLTATYDLGATLGMKPSQGKLALRFTVAYAEQLYHYAKASAQFYPVLRDGLYGGMAMTYSW